MKIHSVITDELTEFEQSLFEAGKKYKDAQLENFPAENESGDTYCQVYVVYSGEYDHRVIEEKLNKEYNLKTVD